MLIGSTSNTLENCGSSTALRPLHEFPS